MNPLAPADVDPAAVSDDEAAVTPTARPDAQGGEPTGTAGATAAPVGRAPVSAPSGVVIGGVVVGAGALLVSAIPFVNVLSVVGGIAAVVIGVLVLRRLAPGAAGRGLAVAAVVLGALATAIATAVLLVVGTLVITGDRITVDELGPVELVEEAVEPIDPDGVAVP